ncbi:ECF transporter S component [Sporolactobacillus inulinus]|uniref:Membrane protein n=2 Tax=Sporolactobacillus inulinus TaxID=2078 RepID=A0A0U1QSG8_9BACL|nr:ECF transporter S component [Sporolactobacillus inulinus]KLI03692.1 membrane protein [Sporolactobacillus inulinus CASD]GEB75990.1 membrane protein [Sporolactobacillus inulinus]
MRNESKNATYRLVLLSIFTAIILLQNFVPFLGYIPMVALSLTIIHITVIIAAIVLGPTGGAIIGGVWGMTTFIRAFTFPTSPVAPIVFTNPLISVFPRIMIGIISGNVYLKLKKMGCPHYVSMSIASLLGALTNTVLVLGLIYLFYRQPYANALHMDVTQLLPALLAIVFTNGIAEAVAACIIAPTVATAILKARSKTAS